MELFVMKHGGSYYITVWMELLHFSMDGALRCNMDGATALEDRCGFRVTASMELLRDGAIISRSSWPTVLSTKPSQPWSASIPNTCRPHFRDLRTYVLHKEILHLPFSVTFEPNSTLLWTCQCLATALAPVNRSWKYLCIPQYDK
jgi:hypothetical protein